MLLQVHHVIFRLDLDRDTARLEAIKRVAAVTGNVHEVSATMTDAERASQSVKELKQQVLVGILDSFQVPIELTGSEKRISYMH